MAGDSFFDCFAFGSKIIICRKGKTLRQQGKQERSASPRKRDGMPRAPLLGELSRQSPRLRGFLQTQSLSVALFLPHLLLH